MNSSASASATTATAIATPTAGPKVVRIWVTDADATDSSSDEDEPPFSSRPIVKKYVTEIRLQPFRATDNGIRNGSLNGDKKRKGSDEAVAAGKKKESDSTTKGGGGGGGGGKVKKFRGVRQRPSGKWAAEIRVPTGRSRMWLGTYNTAEEAAMVYDHAAIQLRGPNAITNFTVPPESTSSGPVDEPQENIGN